jgi:histidinol-phosphate aminotransferase
MKAKRATEGGVHRGCCAERTPMNSRAEALVARWVRREIRELTAYRVCDAAGYIKLDAMENPYTWPQEMVSEWLGRLQKVSVNRYPDPAAMVLTARLREAMGIPARADVLLGNGSDELIQMIAMAMAGRARVVLAPEPTFVMYRIIAICAGLQYVGVPLHDTDFSLDMDAMRAALERHRPAVVFLAYPNNPSGNLFAHQDVEEILQKAPGLVVLDEAYAPFAGVSFMDRAGRHPGLLVMRTLSKLGLAGLRLGLLVGPREWICEINKTRLPYNIDVLTQVSAELALTAYPVFAEQTRRIREDRDRLLPELEALPGVTAYPSRANFILFRVPEGRGDRLFEELKGAGILVKNLHGSHPLLSDCLRVTVGREEENVAFLGALAAALR